MDTVPTFFCEFVVTWKCPTGILMKKLNRRILIPSGPRADIFMWFPSGGDASRGEDVREGTGRGRAADGIPHQGPLPISVFRANLQPLCCCRAYCC